MHCKLTMIAHNLLGTKRDITATAATAATSSEVEAATDADADRDTTAATTNSCRNKFSRREQARCVRRVSLSPSLPWLCHNSCYLSCRTVNFTASRK